MSAMGSQVDAALKLVLALFGAIAAVSGSGRWERSGGLSSHSQSGRIQNEERDIERMRRTLMTG